MSAKPYARLDLTETEFDDVRSCLSACRLAGFERWRGATTDDERAFYQRSLARLDALLARCDAVLIADTSQDAEPDEDEACEACGAPLPFCACTDDPTE